MKDRSFGWACALLLAAAAPGEAAAQVAAGTETQASADLDTIADLFAPEAMIYGSIDSIADTLRAGMTGSADWQALERQYPGVIETRVAAVKAAALAGAPARLAQMRKEALDFFGRELTPREQAAFAAYLRTSYPQRLAKIRLALRPGESADTSFEKAVSEAEAGATPAERRQELTFYASAVGRKCNRLTEQFNAAVDKKYHEMGAELAREAVAKGDEAVRTFVEARASQ